MRYGTMQKKSCNVDWGDIAEKSMETQKFYGNGSPRNVRNLKF